MGKKRRNQQRTGKDKREENKIDEKKFDDQIEGRNSVLELLESGKDINKIYVTRGEKHGSINKILAIARERRIIVVEKDKKQMDEMAQEENYQGVIAIAPPFEYSDIDDILNTARERNEEPFILILVLRQKRNKSAAMLPECKKGQLLFEQPLFLLP